MLAANSPALLVVVASRDAARFDLGAVLDAGPDASVIGVGGAPGMGAHAAGSAPLVSLLLFVGVGVFGGRSFAL